MNEGKKPHKHAKVIKAYADGEEIQVKEQDGGWATLGLTPMFHHDLEYRVKPREFPKSGMSDADLGATWRQADREIGHNPDKMIEAFRYIADAAIKQYILDLEKEAANGF